MGGCSSSEPRYTPGGDIKVTEWKTLVEAGVPEDVAAAQVNKRFDESYPGGLP